MLAASLQASCNALPLWTLGGDHNSPSHYIVPSDRHLVIVCHPCLFTSQVPLRMGEAYCAAIKRIVAHHQQHQQQQPAAAASSTSSTSASSPHAAAAAAASSHALYDSPSAEAVALLDMFLMQAGDAGLMTAASTQMGRQFVQQMLQSGLLQGLTQHLTYMADLLSLQLQAAASASSPDPEASSQQLAELGLEATHMFSVYRALKECCPAASTWDVTAAALRVSFLVFQCVRATLDAQPDSAAQPSQQSPARDSPVTRCHGVWRQAAQTVWEVPDQLMAHIDKAGYTFTEGKTLPARDHAAYAYLLPCCAFTAALRVFQLLILQHKAVHAEAAAAAAPSAAQTSRSGSSRTNNAASSTLSSVRFGLNMDRLEDLGSLSFKQAEQAWRFSLSQQQWLPDSIHQLLLRLGCSSTALLWAADAAAWEVIQATHFERMGTGRSTPTAALQAYGVLEKSLYALDACIKLISQGGTVLRDSPPAQPPAASSAARTTTQLAAAGPPTQAPLQVLSLLPPLLLFCAAHVAPQVDMGGVVNWPGKGPSRMLDCDQLALHSLEVATLAISVATAQIEAHDTVQQVVNSLASAGHPDGLARLCPGMDPSVIAGGRLAALASRMSALQQVQHTAYRDVVALAAQHSRSLMKLLAACQRRSGAGTASSSSSSAGAPVPQKAAVQLLCLLARCDDAWRVTAEMKWHSATLAEVHGMGPGTWEDAFPDSGSQRQSLLGPVSDLYSQHAVQLCALLEAAVRGRRAAPDLSLLMAVPGQESHLALLYHTSSKIPAVYLAAPLRTAAVQAGADSPQAMQLWSLLSSILKLSLLPHTPQLPDAEKPLPWPVQCLSVFAAASSLISPSTYQRLGLGDGPSPEAAVCWVVMLGRCCMLLARLLSAAAAGQGELAADVHAVLLSTALRMRAAGVSARIGGSSTSDYAAQHRVRDVLDSAESGVDAAGFWLTNNMAWLAAQGYPPDTLQGMQQQLLAAAAALRELQLQGACFRVEPGTLTSTAQSLQAIGAALSALVISCGCNNPSCTTLDGPSELQLARGRGSKCGGCKAARFCSRDCQVKHWPLHKPVCKALGAMVAAAPSQG